MDLFHLQEEGPAWSSGTRRAGRCTARCSYMRRRLEADGYDEVKSPQILDRSSGSSPATGRSSATTCSSARRRTSASSGCKPMNCPGHVQIFKHGLQVLPRAAAAHRGVRQAAPLRAVRLAARHHARARTSRRTTRTSSAPRTRSIESREAFTTCSSRSIATSASRT